MERFRSESSQELFSEVAEFTSYALRYSPEEIIRLANNRRRWAAQTTSEKTPRLIGDLIDEALGLIRDLDPSGGQLFFENALKDIERIIKVIIETNRNLDDDTILEAMSHPESIETIALLALRSGEDMQPYLEKLKDVGRISPQNSYVIDDEDLRVQTYGCPAAGYTATDDSEGRVAPLPIFKRFVPWAAEVYLLSDEWQDFRGSLEK